LPHVVPFGASVHVAVQHSEPSQISFCSTMPLPQTDQAGLTAAATAHSVKTQSDAHRSRIVAALGIATVTRRERQATRPENFDCPAVLR
jgi:hypothetical protein